MTPLYEIRVRRDAHTVTPVQVPEYEIAMLQAIFGVENVHNADKKRVDEAGCGTASGSFAPSGDEYERFCAKYGIEQVEQVFGKKGSAVWKQAISGKRSSGTAKNTADAG